MSEDYITRSEHNEFARRIDNKILDLSSQVEKLYDMASSIDVLARDMEHMLNEQIEQGKRLTNLENENGKKWKRLTDYVFTAILGAVIGVVLNKIGLI